MCLNSALGNVETYLADDIPAWVRANLQVDPRVEHWAIGGFSYGGTCSLQLSVRRPDVYRTFLDISGQQEPTLGTRERTVRAAFGGNDDKFRAANPLDILAVAHFETTAGILAVGANDHEYGPQAQRVAEATHRAGIAIQLRTFPGVHSWTIATAALRDTLPWIATRMKILPPS